MRRSLRKQERAHRPSLCEGLHFPEIRDFAGAAREGGVRVFVVGVGADVLHNFLCRREPVRKRVPTKVGIRRDVLRAQRRRAGRINAGRYPW